MDIPATLLFAMAIAVALMIAGILFFGAERLACAQRLGLGLIAAALFLSHPAFPIAFRVLLFLGLGFLLAPILREIFSRGRRCRIEGVK
ncbi:hypothetical protein [Brevundimonas sp.]|jgi:hypothetical protein|uniref:hypothetical protein n=1 Tax=Brevundimonas sp. TaxID=1871086 RepID=UPI0022C00714|nr:hypothetical protein [Brevundimonas sp.]MCZ8194999.1 hypothetical protein [Brevundimonas sp.]